MENRNDNVGKCGHVKCAGGAGVLCYEKGAPMRPYAPSPDYAMERRRALRMFALPCIGRTDRYHGGNCKHCCLRGDGIANTADKKGLEPDYAGWARIYVQAGRTIPRRFAAAFSEELNSDNTLYRDALRDDVEHYGVEIEQ